MIKRTNQPQINPGIKRNSRTRNGRGTIWTGEKKNSRWIGPREFDRNWTKDFEMWLIEKEQDVTPINEHRTN